MVNSIDLYLLKDTFGFYLCSEIEGETWATMPNYTSFFQTKKAAQEYIDSSGSQRVKASTIVTCTVRYN